MPKKTQPRSSRAETIALIPAYNESRFVGSVVLQALEYAAMVVVVDDGSTDATSAIARAAGATVLRLEANRGKAAAMNAGFVHLKRTLKKHSPLRVVVLLDADGQHDCSEIPQVTRPILAGEADIAVGSRYLGAKSRIPKWRIFGQRVLTLLTNVGSGFNLSDSQSGFRAFSRRSLAALDFESEGFSVESEMQFLAQRYDLRVAEVPIHALYDEPPKRNPFNQGLRIIAGIIKLTGQYRPLLFFSIPGILLLLAGMGWGIVVVDRFYATSHLAVGYAMICVLLSILGMILISTGFTLHYVRGLMLDILRARGKRP